MIRLLVVDDDKLVLSSLRKALRRFEGQWEVTYALGGISAKEALEKQTFDVLVADIVMPDLDGGELLEMAQRLHPGMVRIIMTGCRQLETIVRVAPLAHRVLTKPFRPRTLRNAIRQVRDLRERLTDSELRDVISDIDALPAHPRVFFELSRALEDPFCGASEVAGIVEQDPGLSAKSLQLVNSGFFAFDRTITSLRHAVALMGVNTLRGVVLATELRQAFTDRMPSVRLMDRLQEHSIKVATLIGPITEVPSQQPHAFAAGVLHDIGQLVLWSEVPHLQKAVAKEARKSGRPMHEVEIEIEAYGVSHADVGAYLLGLWGVPDPIVEAAALHHEPWKGGRSRIDIVAAAYVAEKLAEGWGEVDDPFADIDVAWAEKVDTASRLPAWEDLAREHLARSAA